MKWNVKKVVGLGVFTGLVALAPVMSASASVQYGAAKPPAASTSTVKTNMMWFGWHDVVSAVVGGVVGNAAYDAVKAGAQYVAANSAGWAEAVGEVTAGYADATFVSSSSSCFVVNKPDSATGSPAFGR